MTGHRKVVKGWEIKQSHWGIPIKLRTTSFTFFRWLWIDLTANHMAGIKATAAASQSTSYITGVCSIQ